MAFHSRDPLFHETPQNFEVLSYPRAGSGGTTLARRCALRSVRPGPWRWRGALGVAVTPAADQKEQPDQAQIEEHIEQQQIQSQNQQGQMMQYSNLQPAPMPTTTGSGPVVPPAKSGDCDVVPRAIAGEVVAAAATAAVPWLKRTISGRSPPPFLRVTRRDFAGE